MPATARTAIRYFYANHLTGPHPPRSFPQKRRPISWSHRPGGIHRNFIPIFSSSARLTLRRELPINQGRDIQAEIVSSSALRFPTSPSQLPTRRDACCHPYALENHASVARHPDASVSSASAPPAPSATPKSVPSTKWPRLPQQTPPPPYLRSTTTPLTRHAASHHLDAAHRRPYQGAGHFDQGRAISLSSPESFQNASNVPRQRSSWPSTAVTISALSA